MRKIHTGLNAKFLIFRLIHTGTGFYLNNQDHQKRIFEKQTSRKSFSIAYTVCNRFGASGHRYPENICIFHLPDRYQRYVQHQALCFPDLLSEKWEIFLHMI